MANIIQGEKKDLFFVLWSDTLSLLLIFFIILFSISELRDQAIYRFTEGTKVVKVKEVDIELSEEQFLMLENFNRIRMVLDDVILNLEYLSSISFDDSFDKNEFDLKMKEFEIILNTIDPSRLNKVKENSLLFAISNINVSKKIKEMFNQAIYEREITEKIKEFGWSDRAKVKIHKDFVDLEILQHSLFKFQSLILPSESKRFLIELSKLLKNVSGQIIVEGHTDNIPVRQNNRIASNWEFSALRAAKVIRFLETQGVSSKRFVLNGFSKNLPVANNNTIQGRKKNRRIVIKVRMNK